MILARASRQPSPASHAQSLQGQKLCAACELPAGLGPPTRCYVASASNELHLDAKVLFSSRIVHNRNCMGCARVRPYLDVYPPPPSMAHPEDLIHCLFVRATASGRDVSTVELLVPAAVQLLLFSCCCCCWSVATEGERQCSDSKLSAATNKSVVNTSHKTAERERTMYCRLQTAHSPSEDNRSTKARGVSKHLQ